MSRITLRQLREWANSTLPILLLSNSETEIRTITTSWLGYEVDYDEVAWPPMLTQTITDQDLEAHLDDDVFTNTVLGCLFSGFMFTHGAYAPKPGLQENPGGVNVRDNNNQIKTWIQRNITLLPWFSLLKYQDAESLWLDAVGVNTTFPTLRDAEDALDTLGDIGISSIPPDLWQSHPCPGYNNINEWGNLVDPGVKANMGSSTYDMHARANSLLRALVRSIAVKDLWKTSGSGPYSLALKSWGELTAFQQAYLRYCAQSLRQNLYASRCAAARATRLLPRPQQRPWQPAVHSDLAMEWQYGYVNDQITASFYPYGPRKALVLGEGYFCAEYSTLKPTSPSPELNQLTPYNITAPITDSVGILPLLATALAGSHRLLRLSGCAINEIHALPYPFTPANSLTGVRRFGSFVTSKNGAKHITWDPTQSNYSSESLTLPTSILWNSGDNDSYLNMVKIFTDDTFASAQAAGYLSVLAN